MTEAMEPADEEEAMFSDDEELPVCTLLSSARDHRTHVFNI
jgi:hypothetical protein